MNYDKALDNFLDKLQDRENRYHAEHFKNLQPHRFDVIRGYKYDKVIAVDEYGSQRAYCWVDKATGGILKGNWKKVEDKRPRGSIYNEDPLEGTNVYGVDYLNMKELNEKFK